MKKINSIDYGGKVIGLGIIFAVILPALLWLLDRVIKYNISILIKISIIIGLLILAIFFIHLMIELYQDHKIDKYYDSHRNIKIPIKNGMYECASCGNRKVKKEDTECQVCGVHFERYKDINVQEILDRK